MTTNKAQKRAVRARMHKTGERYTTARDYELHLEAASEPEAPALPPRVADPGLSDEAILRGSGRTSDQWFALLDAGAPLVGSKFV